MPSFREIIGYIGIPFVYIANGIRWVFNTIATGLGFNMGRVDPGLPDDDHSRDGSANPEEDAERGFDALPNIRSEPTVVVPQAWPPPLEAVAKETLPVLRKNPLLSTSRPLITEGVADGSLRVEASTTPRTSISSDMPVPVSAITEAQRPSSQLFSSDSDGYLTSYLDKELAVSAADVKLENFKDFLKILAVGEELTIDEVAANNAIIDSSGMPRSLAKIIKESNSFLGETMTTIRVGTHPHHDRPRASKPLTVHSKTVNHGFLYGYICTDENLAKIDQDRKIVEGALDLKDIEKPGHGKVQLKLTLREIFRSLSFNGNTEDRDMEIVRVEPSSDDTQSTLVLKYRDGKGPAGFTGEFLVNLHDPSRQLVQHFYDSDEDPNKLKDEGLQKEIGIYLSSTNLDSERGEETIQKCLKEFLQDSDGYKNLDMEIPIYYKQSKDSTTSEPLEVFSLKVGEEDKPITGDWDIDFESIPLDSGFPEAAYEPINTMNSVENRNILIARTGALFDYFKKQTMEKISSLCDELSKAKKDSPEYEKLELEYDKITSSGLGSLIAAEVERSEPFNFNDFFTKETIESLAAYTGNITPFEFLQNITRNYFYNKGVDKEIGCFPLQHGPENRSPYKGNATISPDSGGVRLHIYKGRCFYTHSEEERVQLHLMEGFLEKNFIDIHPASKMELWHPVIARQIELGHKISPETRQAYDLYIESVQTSAMATVAIAKKVSVLDSYAAKSWGQDSASSSVHSPEAGQTRSLLARRSTSSGIVLPNQESIPGSLQTEEHQGYSSPTPSHSSSPSPPIGQKGKERKKGKKKQGK